MSMDDAFGHRVTKLGALADPVRRALYRFVARPAGRGQPRPGRRRDRRAAAHREVPPRPAGRRGPAGHRVPAAHRTQRTRCRAAGQALPPVPQGGRGQPAQPALRPRRRRARRRRRAVPGRHRDGRRRARGRHGRRCPRGRGGRRPGPRGCASWTGWPAVLAPFGYEPARRRRPAAPELPVRPARHRPHRPGLRDEPRLRRRRRRRARLHRRAPELDPDPQRCCVRVRERARA